MTLIQQAIALAERSRSVSAAIGSAAAFALVIAGLLCAHTPDDTMSAARTHHGDGGEYTSPTASVMSLGATTVGPTEDVQQTPPPAPSISFAAPKIKAAQ